MNYEGNAYDYDPDLLYKYDKILQQTRKSLRERGFIEAKTPLLNTPSTRERTLHESITVGSTEQELRFLRQSPALTPLLTENSKIFELGPCFRAEKGPHHNLDFNIVYFVIPGGDHLNGKRILLKLIKAISTNIHKSTTFVRDGVNFDVDSWERRTFSQIINNSYSIGADVYNDPQKLKSFCENSTPIDTSKNPIKNNDNRLYHYWLLDKLLEKAVEEQLRTPTQLAELPYNFGAHAKRLPNDSEHKEKIDFYIDGVEVGTTRTFETDPQKLAVWRDDVTTAMKSLNNQEDIVANGDYLEMIDDTSVSQATLGALGFDRLAMMLLDVPSVADVLPYRFS